MDTALALYDENCGICKALAEGLAERGIPVAPIGSSKGDVWLRDLKPRERYATFHAIDSAGRRRSGAPAVPHVLRSLGLGPLGLLSRALPSATEVLYGLVARHRRLLARIVGAAPCSAEARRNVRRASRARAD